MKKHLSHKLLGLTLAVSSFMLPNIVFAQTQTGPALEDANQVLAKSLEKIQANYKGKMYKTDTLPSVMAPGRVETMAYFGLFLTTATSTQSLETVTKSNMIGKVMDFVKGVVHTENISSTEFFVNGVRSATTTYADDYTKIVQGTVVESYKSAIKSNDKKMVTLGTVIDAKLKSKGVSDAKRIKAMNKLYSVSYLKLNSAETFTSLDTLLGFNSLASTTLESVDVERLKVNFLPYAMSLLKVKKDDGMYETWYTYNPNPRSSKLATTTFDTRKLVLSIDTDALVDAAVKQRANDIVPGDNIQLNAIDNAKRIAKDLYGELEIEMYIDVKTYDIRELNVPEYQISYTTDSATRTLVFSYHLNEAATTVKTVTLPKTSITPTAFRALFK